MTEEEIQERWEENLRAVQEAKRRVLTVFRDYSRVRARAAASARRRNPIHPVLNAEEQADVEVAGEAWIQSKVDLADAQGWFKAGVPEA